EMFGKLMSISDGMMREYFELCTAVPMGEVDRLLQDSREGRVNPKNVKRRLAREVIAIYHGEAAATAADAEFDRVHARHERPVEIPEFHITDDLVRDGKVWICRLLAASGLAKGTGDA